MDTTPPKRKFGLNMLTPADRVLLTDGERFKLVVLGDIRYFESYGNYCKTYYEGGMLLINRTLKNLDPKLPQDVFFRASRKHIVNLHHIIDIQLNENAAFSIQMSCGKKLEISRRRSRYFKQCLSL